VEAKLGDEHLGEMSKAKKNGATKVAQLSPLFFQHLPLLRGAIAGATTVAQLRFLPNKKIWSVERSH
jgi:hypothetical protein